MTSPLMRIDPQLLTREAEALINRAEQQHRDLSDFECGKIDTLLDLVRRLAPVDQTTGDDE
jgi:hypothetical protein